MLTAGVLPQPPASRRNGSNSILVRPNAERPWWKFSNTRSIPRRRVWKGSHSRDLSGDLVSLSSDFAGSSFVGSAISVPLITRSGSCRQCLSPTRRDATLRKNHFLAQFRTAGRATAPLLEHCTSRSSISIDTAFAPQNAEIAISSAAQPSGHPPDPQSIRRILLPDSPGLPLSPLSPFTP